MRSNRPALLIGFILPCLVLSSCAGLPAVAEEEIFEGDFGPAYIPGEHQTRTFEALWRHLEDDYIHYNDADVDWQSVHDRHIRRIDGGLTSDEFSALLKGLESELPENSIVYQSRTERIAADIQNAATYEGIGAFVGFEAEPVPHVVVLDVIKGSPAESGGLKAHDSILEIDGDPVRLDEGVRVIERIRGPAGSSVRLLVQSPGGPKRRLTLTRTRLNSTAELRFADIIGTDYGYLLFPPIAYDGLIDDVLGSLQTLSTNRRLEGLVLDLRIARASQGWPLEELLTLFHDGIVGEFYSRNDRELFGVSGQDVINSQSIPLIILVGENTAGFPEILAAGLQAGRRAIIIGAPTGGAVETATTYYLPDGSRVLMESASFRLLNGEEIGLNGITPDVLIEAGWDEVLTQSDPLIEASIEVLGAAE